MALRMQQRPGERKYVPPERALRDLVAYEHLNNPKKSVLHTARRTTRVDGCNK